MIEKPLHTKKELKRLFIDLKNKGITDEMMGILIDVLWRDKTSSRSAGFFWPGGPDLSLNWDDVTRTLTLTPAPALDPESAYVPHFRFFSFISKPVLHRRYNPESIILPNEEGLYAIYYDVHPDTRLQALTYTKNPDEFAAAAIIMDKVLVAWIYWDAVAGKALYFGDSRYGSEWPPQIHFWAHKTLNSLRQDGLAITDATFEAAGLSDQDADFSISAGTLWHEDIFAETSEVPVGEGLPVWYFDQNGLPRYTSQPGNKIINTGSGLLAYNPPAAGIAEASDLNYVVYHYFATNCIFQPHIACMGQQQYALRSLASAAIKSEVILLKDSLPHSNLMHIGSVVFQTSSSYTNNYRARAIFGTDEAGVTSVFTEQDPVFPIDYLKYVTGNQTINVTELYKPNGILAGGYISWTGGLKFLITPVAGRIMRELYKIPTYQSVTLPAADPDYPRIDLIVMDNTPAVRFLAGIPSENPQKPAVDPAKQIELTHVLIPAGALEPAGVTFDMIYDENTEWTPSANGVVVNFNSADSPFSGTKCTDVGAIGNGDSLTFTASESKSFSDYETLVAFVKLKEAMNKQHFLEVEFLLNNTPVSNTVTALTRVPNSGEWINITVSLSSFQLGGNEFDAVRFRWTKQGAQIDHAGFYFDVVKLEAGIQQPVTNSTDETVKLIDPVTFNIKGQSGYLSTDDFEQKVDETSGRAVISLFWDNVKTKLKTYFNTLYAAIVHSHSIDTIEFTVQTVKYAYLYNWWSVTDNRNIAASGWRAPSKADWTTLIQSQYPEATGTTDNLMGIDCKVPGFTYWDYFASATPATNSLGWNGRGGGYRASDGGYYSLNRSALILDEYNTAISISKLSGSNSIKLQ